MAESPFPRDLKKLVDKASQGLTSALHSLTQSTSGPPEAPPQTQPPSPEDRQPLDDEVSLPDPQPPDEDNNSGLPDWARPPIRVISTQGVVTVDGLNSWERSLIGRHWNAAGRYLDTGNIFDLFRFHGITLGGYELETRPSALDYYGMVGELD